MKQEEETQSRFLISFSFFYCRRWMGPDDEFSLICFRPINEKTRTTSLSPPPTPFRRLPKEAPEDLSYEVKRATWTLATITTTTIQDLDPGYVRMTSHAFISNERFRYETLRSGHSIPISRMCILVRPIVVLQRLFHLVKSPFAAETIQV